MHSESPYGKVLREFNPATDARCLSTYHERDKETGFDYRGARFYDSDLGRFLSLDPHAIDYPSLSDYNYVAGNPVLLIDADGKDPTYPITVRAFAPFDYFGDGFNGDGNNGGFTIGNAADKLHHTISFDIDKTKL